MRRISVGEKTLEREGKRAPTSLYNLQRSVSRNSSGQELKFIYSTRATIEITSFIEDLSKELEKSKVSSLGSVHGTSRVSSMLKEVGIIPTLVIFHYRGCLVEF